MTGNYVAQLVLGCGTMITLFLTCHWHSACFVVVGLTWQIDDDASDKQSHKEPYDVGFYCLFCHCSIWEDNKHKNFWGTELSNVVNKITMCMHATTQGERCLHLCVG